MGASAQVAGHRVPDVQEAQERPQRGDHAGVAVVSRLGLHPGQRPVLGAGEHCGHEMCAGAAAGMWASTAEW